MADQLIEIQGCQVSQLIANSQDVELSSGPLALIKQGDGLRLVCGTAAFSLDKQHPFYTHADSDRVYLFSPTLPCEESTKTYVKILLPAAVIEEGSQVAQARNKFEAILIEHGFLKEGIAAMGDEYVRGVSDSISSLKADHLKSPSSDIGTFSETTHMIADKAVEVSKVAADYTQELGKTVGNVAVGLGQKISSFVKENTAESKMLHGEGGILADPQVKEAGEKIKSGASVVGAGISSAATSIGAGLTSFYNTATTAVQDVIKHDLGQDSAKLSSQAGETTANAGTVASEAYMGTSLQYHAAKVADGAVRGEEAKR